MAKLEITFEPAQISKMQREWLKMSIDFRRKMIERTVKYAMKNNAWNPIGKGRLICH